MKLGKKMNQEIKVEWLAALRSGDYIQGTEQLRDANNNFCCLGVLCNLHAIANPEIAAKQKRKQSYRGTTTNLPPTVAKWAGLDPSENCGPYVRIGDRNGSLTDFNDTGSTFAEIADAIEAEL